MSARTAEILFTLACISLASCSSTCDPACCSECAPRVEVIRIPGEPVIRVIPPPLDPIEVPELETAAVDLSEPELELLLNDFIRAATRDLGRLLLLLREAKQQRDDLIAARAAALHAPDG